MLFQYNVQSYKLFYAGKKSICLNLFKRRFSGKVEEILIQFLVIQERKIQAPGKSTSDWKGTLSETLSNSGISFSGLDTM